MGAFKTGLCTSRNRPDLVYDNKNANRKRQGRFTSMNRTEQLIKHLEHRVDELIELCDEYKRHNKSLRGREQQLADERANLMKKNDMARNKVESMIVRLKALEQDS